MPMPESDTPPLLGSQPATEEQKAWHAYLRAAKQEEPKRLEEAAKFLAGMISITFTIFLSADKELLQHAAPGLPIAAALLWLIALLLAFAVLYPMPYRTVRDSAEAIEQMHQQLVRRKTFLLAGAVIAFLVALGLLTGVFVGAMVGG